VIRCSRPGRDWDEPDREDTAANTTTAEETLGTEKACKALIIDRIRLPAVMIMANLTVSARSPT
jgi:hypothetical protein